MTRGPHFRTYRISGFESQSVLLFSVVGLSFYPFPVVIKNFSLCVSGNLDTFYELKWVLVSTFTSDVPLIV